MKLIEWIKLKGLTRSQAADFLCASRQTLYTWLKINKKPPKPTINRIHKLTQGKVKEEDWE